MIYIKISRDINSDILSLCGLCPHRSTQTQKRFNQTATLDLMSAMIKYGAESFTQGDLVTSSRTYFSVLKIIPHSTQIKGTLVWLVMYILTVTAEIPATLTRGNTAATSFRRRTLVAAVVTVIAHTRVCTRVNTSFVEMDNVTTAPTVTCVRWPCEHAYTCNNTRVHTLTNMDRCIDTRVHTNIHWIY